jgi:uncharacterized protein YndB with AHSA1/START domain
MASAARSGVSTARGASAQHATFVIERNFAASPARVFAAWASEQAKSRWFAGSEAWKEDSRSFDFRVGGREHLRGTWRDGHVSDFEARYHDIVPNRRIVYSYGMHIDDTRISVSLSTVEFKAADTDLHRAGRVSRRLRRRRLPRTRHAHSVRQTRSGICRNQLNLAAS